MEPILIAEKASVQAPLSAENGVLRYSLKAHGQGFRRAGLELVRKIHTGRLMANGLERVTATERLAEALPGEIVQSEWRPVTSPANPLLLATGSFPSKSDVVTVLRSSAPPSKIHCSWGLEEGELEDCVRARPWQGMSLS